MKLSRDPVAVEEKFQDILKSGAIHRPNFANQMKTGPLAKTAR